MRWGTLLLVIGCALVACKKQQAVEESEAYDAEAYNLSELFYVQADVIYSHITGRCMFEDGTQKVYKQNFSAAHKSFSVLEKMVREYPIITKHPIAPSTCEVIKATLTQLELVIMQETEGKEQNRFIVELNQIKKLVN